MTKNSLFPMLPLLAIVLLVVMACTAQQDLSVPLARHPSAAELGEEPKDCLKCHEARGEYIEFGRYVHTADRGRSHRAEALQGAAVCAMCHETSFCYECHATKTELKPSLKNQSETYRGFMHRGDYLSRHRIDGRVDPTSCLRCHGNPKAADTCARCHG